MAIGLESDSELSNQIFDIIAEEAGISRDELDENTDWADLGVDHVLSRSILAKVSRLTKVALPPTIFVDCQDVQKLQVYLQQLSKASPKMPPINVKKAPLAATPTLVRRQSSSLSNLLQGKPASSKKTIFLLPDGSGSGMAYGRLPPIAKDVCLVGLNSPFLSTVSDYTCKLEDLAPTWVKEIRSRQSVGPYILGGWSAGGYYAFEVAKQLIQEGEIVEKLILIDSPCRLVFEELPMEVVEYLAANNLMGNWGGRKTPEWLIKHFDATIKAISQYTPTEFGVLKSPEIFIIWAKDGVLKGIIDPAETGLDLSKKVTRFMLEDKDVQAPYGWEKLFPQGNISIAGMSGNHFTLVYPPDVSFDHLLI